MQPRLGAGGLPRTELSKAPGVTRADNKDVALADGNALTACGGLQVLGDDLLAGFEPWHPAEPGNVE
jgi:hypothetical protein